jgi:hypothetical protein
MRHHEQPDLRPAACNVQLQIHRAPKLLLIESSCANLLRKQQSEPPHPKFRDGKGEIRKWPKLLLTFSSSV